jgi:hypothetical protein
MRASALFTGLLIAGSLLVAPVYSAVAGRDRIVRDGRTIETYPGANKFARERARKVQRQERGYRTSERKRLARVAKRDRRVRRYDGPWGPFYGPPGLF